MNKLFWLFIIAFVALNAIQAYVSSLDSSQITPLPEGVYKSTLTFLNTWRYWIAGLLAVGIAIFPTLREFSGPVQIKKAMRHAVMETIVSNVFEGNRLNIRVTIFKDIGWTRLFLKYVGRMIRHPILFYRNPNKRLPRLGKYVIATKRI